MLTLEPTRHQTPESDWPADVCEAIAILERTPTRLIERRRMPRARLAVAGRLEVDGRELTVYTRDANPWALRLICAGDVAPGARATLRLPLGGAERELPCIVGRGREFTEGWFEVMVRFARREGSFAEYGD